MDTKRRDMPRLQDGEPFPIAFGTTAKFNKQEKKIEIRDHLRDHLGVRKLKILRDDDEGANETKLTKCKLIVHDLKYEVRVRGIRRGYKDWNMIVWFDKADAPDAPDASRVMGCHGYGSCMRRPDEKRWRPRFTFAYLSAKYADLKRAKNQDVERMFRIRDLVQYQLLRERNSTDIDRDERIVKMIVWCFENSKQLRH